MRASIGWRLRNIVLLLPLMILLGVAVQISFSYILSFVLSFNETAAREYDEVIAPLTSMEPSMIFHVGVRAPIFEELIFRGLAFEIFKSIIMAVMTVVGLDRVPKAQRAGRVLANILQALFFGIYHGNIYQGIYAFIIGLLFGMIRIASGSVIPGIIAHASVNLFGMYMDRFIPAEMEGVGKVVLAAVSFMVMALVLWGAETITAKSPRHDQ